MTTTTAASTVAIARSDDGAVWTVTLNRPDVRNAVDGPTSRALADAFRAFDADSTACVAVLHGAGGHFCAGADLKTVAALDHNSDDALPLNDDLNADGPMGPTRLQLRKPVIAAVEGYAVAGGIELALWCDLRVASETAVFGVFCRRFGVPLIDGGTVRLPRLIGQSRALDLILTGRPVNADEALRIGLANRVVAPGQALAAAQALAREIAAFPQECLRNDRASVYAQHGHGLHDALATEFALGRHTLASGEAVRGAGRFTSGAGRHGAFGPKG
ncbi:MAG TPA: crotonase/enoyl-CoA hydratase family protein [Burkholderiaceae bacterium]|nr:crotonase/enoyl-CoA hydratase family protein [Burkholderiaceae bacterium]